jgi:hypothetical protein
MMNDELPELAPTAMGLVSLIHRSSFIIHHFPPRLSGARTIHYNTARTKLELPRQRRCPFLKPQG